MEQIEIKGPNFPDRRFHKKVQNITAGPAGANDRHDVFCKLG